MRHRPRLLCRKFPALALALLLPLRVAIAQSDPLLSERASNQSSFLMVAEGEMTNLPRAVAISEPYDSLSFVPTVLALTGNLRDDSSPIPILWDRGFRKFPGRLITEILPAKHENQENCGDGSRR